MMADSTVAKVFSSARESLPSLPASSSIGSEQPVFSEKSEMLGHIFRRIKGHLPTDTPENRKLILKAVASRENYRGTTNFGEHYYSRLMPDGTQVWALVSEGIIRNGGLNRIPLSFIPDKENYRGYRLIPAVQYCLKQPSSTDFDVIIQFHRLVQVHGKLGTINSGVSKKDLKGVGQKFGEISNAFHSVRSLFDKQHCFFIPLPDGCSIDRKEIQQIVAELGRGIFLHGEVPFFSLENNRDGTKSPIIHPVYQGTFVGHVISLLDYHMKCFLEGMYFEPDFVCSWTREKNKNEEYLRRHCVDLRKHCRQHGKPYMSFSEMLVEAKGGFGDIEAIVDRSRSVSFRIIVKQESIRYIENLFIPNSDFDVEFSIKPEFEEEITDQIMRKACERMASQIRELMPQLPFFSKYFQLLSIINFFTYYLITLQKAHKVPQLEQAFSLENLVCPVIFPPMPIAAEAQGIISLNVLSLFEDMDRSDKEVIFQTICDESINLNKSSSIVARLAAVFRDKMRTNLDYSESFLHKAALHFLTAYRRIYKNFNAVMDQALVIRKFKKANEAITQRIIDALCSKNDQYLRIVDQDISEIEKIIVQRRIAGLSVEKQLSEQMQHQKTRTQILEDSRMYRLWFSDRMLSCTHDKVFIIDVLENSACFSDKKPKGESLITGGLYLHRKDIEAVMDESYTGLLDRCEEQIPMLNQKEMLRVEGGVLFKLLFEDLPLVRETEKASALHLFACGQGKALSDRVIRVFHALANPDIAKFESIELGNENIEDPVGVPLVHYTAQKTNTAFLRSMVRRGISLDSVDRQHYTVLHYAAEAGILSNINFIVEQNPRLLNAVATNGETALYLSAAQGHLECVRYFLEKKANINLQTSQGFNALLISIYKGFEDVALAIIDDDSTDVEVVLRDRSNALHFAVERKMEKLLSRLIHYLNAAQVRRGGYNALHIAAEIGWLRGVQILVGECSHIDINATTAFAETALDLAVERGYQQISQFLRQNGGKRKIEDLDIATGQSDVAADSTAEKEMTLHEACLSSNADAVHTLLQKGVDPRLENDKGMTAMDLAVLVGNITITEELCEEGVFIVDRMPYVRIAAGEGHLRMIAWLLTRGALIDHTDERGWTGAHFAAKKGDKATLSLLCCMGANLELETLEGDTVETLSNEDCLELIKRYKEMALGASSRLETAIRLGDINAISLLANIDQVQLPTSLPLSPVVHRILKQ